MDGDGDCLVGREQSRAELGGEVRAVRLAVEIASQLNDMARTWPLVSWRGLQGLEAGLCVVVFGSGDGGGSYQSRAVCDLHR